MSSRIVIVAVAAPGATSCTTIPRARDAASAASIRVTESVTAPPSRRRLRRSDRQFGGLDGGHGAGLATKRHLCGRAPTAEVEEELACRTAERRHAPGSVAPTFAIGPDQLDPVGADPAGH